MVDGAVEVRAFARWDDGWRYEPGSFIISAGSSAADLPLNATIGN